MANDAKRFIEFQRAVAESAAEGERVEKLVAEEAVRQARRDRGCCPKHGTQIRYGAFDALCGECEAENDAAWLADGGL